MIQTKAQIEPKTLFKLRVCVARFGEMDRAGWWNTKGVLAGIGRTVYQRGFAATHYFAQSRVACAVAAARCQEVFAPPGCLTLWSLPAEVEDGIDSSWQRWCRDAELWSEFFERVADIEADDLPGQLRAMDLIDDATVEAVKGLRRSAEGKSVALPGSGSPDDETVKLLAAAFARGEKSKLAVPYIKADE